MHYFHFQTNISPAFINSLAVGLKIAGIGEQIQYAWGKSIMIIKKKKKKYQGISRPRPRDGNIFPRLKRDSPVSSTLLQPCTSRNKLQSTWRRTSDKNTKNKQPFCLTLCTTQQGTDSPSQPGAIKWFQHCGTVKSLPCRPSQNKCDVNAIMKELCVWVQLW